MHSNVFVGCPRPPFPMELHNGTASGRNGRLEVVFNSQRYYVCGYHDDRHDLKMAAAACWTMMCLPYGIVVPPAVFGEGIQGTPFVWLPMSRKQIYAPRMATNCTGPIGIICYDYTPEGKAFFLYNDKK